MVQNDGHFSVLRAFSRVDWGKVLDQAGIKDFQTHLALGIRWLGINPILKPKKFDEYFMGGEKKIFPPQKKKKKNFFNDAIVKTSK